MKNDLTFSYTLTDKEKQSSYKSIVVWFFGLSGSGKSTLCNSIEQSLFQNNINNDSNVLVNQLKPMIN